MNRAKITKANIANRQQLGVRSIEDRKILATVADCEIVRVFPEWLAKLILNCIYGTFQRERERERDKRKS